MEKILSWDKLKKAVVRLKAKNKKVVFTNGCFDIIHIGHVRYLKEAKGLGDVLIIGLNSDRSISSIKPDRPINPQNHRAEVLSSLEMVDYVVLFDEETPYELIKLIQPDVLVKGGDYEVANIAGAAEVLAAGGRVLTLPFHPGFSSTSIIAKHVPSPEEES